MGHTTVVESELQELYAAGSRGVLDYLQGLSPRSQILIGVCGGRSVVGLLHTLRIQSALKHLWSKMHFFMVDERMVPLENELSNYFLVNREFFTGLCAERLLHPAQLHPFHIHESAPDRGVKKYENEFHTFGAAFDLAFLGVGEDGHVASLFPKHPSIAASGEDFILVEHAPKPPPLRISASHELLAKTGCLLGIFTGENKREAYQKFKNPRISISECPAKVLLSARNSLVLTDMK